MQPDQLTIKQTATGYWTVQRGNIHVAGAMTRAAAESELELRRRLRRQQPRRSARPAIRPSAA